MEQNETETKAAPKATARAATLAELRANVLPLFIAPIPSNETLRAWFDAAGVPRFKTNPLAKRGGGLTFYQVAAVERLLRSRLTPCRVPCRAS